MISIRNKIVLIFILALTIIALVACGKSSNPAQAPIDPMNQKEVTNQNGTTDGIDRTALRVATLKGPTGMGMVELIEQQAQGVGAFEYDITLYDSPDALVGKVISGEVEIAAVPTNLALVLYNRTGGEVQLVAVNTLGVLYLLENGDSIQSIDDLKGKQLSVSGKGATPDFITRYVLEANSLTPDKDVPLDFKLEHADLAAALVAGDVKLAVLPQPHVTTAMARNDQIRIALNLNEVWEQATGGQILPMGSIIVQKRYATENPEKVQLFLEEYRKSVTFVNEQIDSASQLIEKHQILPNAAIAKKAIPNSNIVFMKAQESKEFLENYYQVLFDYEPKSIGGKLPDEGFYFKK